MRVISILTFIIVSNFAKSQNLECKDFKTGTFKLESINYKLPITTIIRTGNIQKEMDSNVEMEGTIEWKTECSYELIYTNASPEINGKKINVQIEKVEGKTAFCKSTFEDLQNLILEFKMMKIE